MASMNPISGLLIGTLLSVSMVPSKSDLSSTAAASAQTAVNESRASLAPTLPSDGTSAPSTISGQMIDLTGFALDAQEAAKATAQAAAVQDSDQAPDVPATPRVPKRQILVFKATWCGACQLLNPAWPKLREVNWRIGEQNTDHFRLVDSDQHPDLISRYGITALPTIVLLENGREIDRTGQILNAVDLAEFYYGRLR
ncbi:thioredoxin fold domain-containing protein [bacterium]|nr:thioredoxin fold domain-containing protein [bacterium]